MLLAAIACAAVVPSVGNATAPYGTCPNSSFESYYSGYDSADLNNNQYLCGKTNSGYYGGVSIDDHSQSKSPH